MGQSKHEYAPANWCELLPQGLAWQQQQTVVEIDGGWWWWLMSDGGSRGNIGQRCRMTEMAVDGSGQWRDGGGNGGK
jgi:hypothetical protein